LEENYDGDGSTNRAASVTKDVAEEPIITEDEVNQHRYYFPPVTTHISA